jgi:hypothetical protein
VPQQKGKQLLALATKIVSRGLARADKIASPSDPRLIALEYRPIDVRFGADAEVVMR